MPQTQTTTKAAAPPRVRTVIAYTRSGADTIQGQRWVQRQRTAIQAEADFQGWTVAAWTCDLGQPGDTLDRCGLKQALALLSHGRADALVAYDDARLTRLRSPPPARARRPAAGLAAADHPDPASPRPGIGAARRRTGDVAMSVPTLPQPIDDAAALVRTVVCYLRTANAGTAGQRLLGRQRAKLERETAAHGWTVLEWIEDLHQSGTTLLRPGLHQALALLADHQADALLACDLTRLAATPEVVDELAALADRQGWRLLTLELLSTRSPALPGASSRTGGPA